MRRGPILRATLCTALRLQAVLKNGFHRSVAAALILTVYFAARYDWIRVLNSEPIIRERLTGERNGVTYVVSSSYPAQLAATNRNTRFNRPLNSRASLTPPNDRSRARPLRFFVTLFYTPMEYGTVSFPLYNEVSRCILFPLYLDFLQLRVYRMSRKVHVFPRNDRFLMGRFARQKFPNAKTSGLQ